MSAAPRSAGAGAAAYREPKGDLAAPRSLEVPPARLVQDWKIADERARQYLSAVGVPPNDHERLVDGAMRRALAREHWEAGGDAVSETMDALRELLVASQPTHWGADLALDPEVTWRLARATDEAPTVRNDRLWSTPPLARRAMVPEGFAARRATSRSERRRRGWIGAARRRRLLLGLLVLLPSVVASGFMLDVLPRQGQTSLEVAIVVVFGALFGWISVGFWTATAGFLVLLFGRDRFSVTRLAETPASEEGLGDDVRVAVVMPICEEPVERVFAGMRSTRRSLERAGGLAHFDFFVLSDSTRADTTAREEQAWLEWCRETKGFGRIFYRRRKARLARKTGNIADFLRRFGRQYRYMVVLDADSVMAGETLVRLASIMEANPHIGLVQTVPSGVERHSLLARAQQFATRAYGPMYAAGLHFWQLGDGQYWGHNAILRIEPFMDHCALAHLPGKPPLGGEILSHDFVEAALLARAGWEIWLAYDLPGSYEEVPSTLLEEMQRDRRWCQGNLQHARLLFTRGLYGAHRVLFLNGVFSYTSALLWLTFLTLSTVEALRHALVQPDYFPNGPSLFPEWPVWRPDWVLSLLGVTAAILFVPKFLSVVLISFKQRRARDYGGFFHLIGSVVLEIVLSAFLAPIRMAFHSRFVVTNLLGRTVSWTSLGREDAETSWREAFRRHALDTLVSSAWGAMLLWLDPGYFWWITPIVGALVLSLPISVLTSRVRLGDAARRAGLLLTPEETEPPPELRDLNQRPRSPLHGSGRTAATEGFVRVAVDPLANATHRALLGAARSVSPRIRARRTALVRRALDDGPANLTERERQAILADPASVDALHRGVWALGDRVRAGQWMGR